MSREDIAVAQNTDNLERLSAVVLDAIDDVKGKNVVKMDLRELPDASTDMFIVCTGNSSTQLKGILDNVERKVFQNFGYHPNHVEGTEGGGWMLMDFFNLVVHVFSKEKRQFYDLESLWGDAKLTKYESEDDD